jgi:hypothetical protein
MKHQVELLSAYAACFKPIACSEQLLNTSNSAFTDWQLNTYFSIKDKKPYAYYEVTDKAFSRNVLFKTDNYDKLEKWIEDHMKEIQTQIDIEADKWIEENKKYYDTSRKDNPPA